MKQNRKAITRSGESKWQAVLRGALDEIENGRFAPGDRFYSLRELGAAYGVSEITAQRVFRELAARGRIVTNRRSGTRVAGGRNLGTVYLCFRNELFDIPDPFERFRRMNAFLEGFRDAANGQIRTVEPVALDFLLTHIARYRKAPILVHATALLKVTDGRGMLNETLVNRLQKTFNPIVIKGFGPIPGVSLLYYDLYGGSRMLVDHLARRHTHIGCLTGPPECVWFRPRFQGFMDGLRAHDLRFVPEWVRVTSGEDPQEDFRAMDAIMTLPDRPTALVCGNDLRALRAMDYCRRHDIRVPEDLAITGMDNLPEASVCSPGLTTLDFNDRKSGAQAAKWLLKRESGHPETLLRHRIPPRLIAREST